MSDDWKRIEGTGWIPLDGFGRINPRRDNVGDAGRTYFTAMTASDEYARALGNCITGGPETWFYEPDQPFYLSDSTGETCVEMEISLLEGGKYGVRFRPGQWPQEGGGAW